MDIDRLCWAFGEQGIRARVLTLAEASRDLGPHWRDRLVVYQSAEDPGLRYRGFVEDVVLGLESLGARVMPDFLHLRSHHNKVFGEMLATIMCGAMATRPATWCFGCLEEFNSATVPVPAVVKRASAAGSAGVALGMSARIAARLVRRASRSPGIVKAAREVWKRAFRPGYVPYSLHRERTVVQEYIPGLAYDYKVLCYGRRVYLLKRSVRPGDFRASGSGRFSWPETAQDTILDFAARLHEAFDAPCCSLDIAESDSGPLLLESQFVLFGPLTLEYSQWHFERHGGAWVRIDGPSQLEVVFAECISEFARRKGWVR